MIFGGNDTSKFPKLHVNFSGEMIFGGNDRQSHHTPIKIINIGIDECTCHVLDIRDILISLVFTWHNTYLALRPR